MAKGTIRRLVTGRGFGFIQTAECKDLFFHRSGLQGVDYYSLREGQEVEFEVGEDSVGRPQAVKVRLAEPDSVLVNCLSHLDFLADSHPISRPSLGFDSTMP